MSKLNEKEINLTLEKIRKEHLDGLEKYKMGMYNLEAFNDRYRDALSNRHDLSIFLMDEVKALDEIRNAILKRKEINKKIEERKEYESAHSFSNKVDSIIEEFRHSISKYPRETLHENADYEIEHLYGAFKELYSCFSVVKFFVLYKGTDYSIETLLKDIDNRFQPFVYSLAIDKCPHVYSDYIFTLNVGEMSSRSEQYILKEGGLFLHFFIDSLESVKDYVLKNNTSSNAVLPDFLKRESERVYNFFSDKSVDYIYNATIEYAKDAIVDFRLKSFKKHV